MPLKVFYMMDYILRSEIFQIPVALLGMKSRNVALAAREKKVLNLTI